MADDGTNGQQQAIDFQRAEQLAILRDCQLPRTARDKAGKGVRGYVLKAVLSAIDHYGRGRAGGAFPSIPTLAGAANIGERTCCRALEVLTALGLICVTGCRGNVTNRYTLVWAELALLRPGRLQPSDHRATGTDHRATGTDHRATGTDHRATGSAQSALSDKKRRLNVRPADGTGRDGALDAFTEEELTAVRFKANTIDKWIAATQPADRQLILKIATLWHDAKITDDEITQVLESFERKRAAGVAIDKPCGWLWTTLRNQLAKCGLRLEQLLATTRWPQKLLTRQTQPLENLR